MLSVSHAYMVCPALPEVNRQVWHGS